MIKYEFGLDCYFFYFLSIGSIAFQDMVIFKVQVYLSIDNLV